MHESSFNLMKEFIGKYVNRGVHVCDIGSQDINGCYKSLFAYQQYTGLDMCAGRNVDVIAKDPYEFPFADNTFDIVVSGQTAEHVKNLHLWIKEVARITKKGGIVCVIAPITWKEHRYPIDCWRILPDGMRFLMSEIAGLEIMEIRKENPDCIGIARK